MGIETSVAHKKGKEFSELAKEKNHPIPYPNPNPNPKANTNSRGKKSRRRHHNKKSVVTSPVQKLYETCKEVFASGGPGIVPSPDNIEKLKAVLDDIKPADVGLRQDMSHFRTAVPGRTPAITYLHLYECDKFSIGIFCLPPSGVIPLHNHPGMTVFSKLLFGTMHIKSYDWVADVPCNMSAVVNPSKANESDVQLPEEKQLKVQQTELKPPKVQQAELKPPKVQQPEVRLAKVKVNSNFTAPCNTSILYPADGGNMHCFTAVNACAVLDVLGPPYSDPDGRHCQYYFDFPFTKFSVDGMSIPEEEREGYAWLQEREDLEDLTVVGEPYRGPKIVEK